MKRGYTSEDFRRALEERFGCIAIGVCILVLALFATPIALTFLRQAPFLVER